MSDKMCVPAADLDVACSTPPDLVPTVASIGRQFCLPTNCDSVTKFFSNSDIFDPRQNGGATKVVTERFKQSGELLMCDFVAVGVAYDIQIDPNAWSIGGLSVPVPASPTPGTGLLPPIPTTGINAVLEYGHPVARAVKNLLQAVRITVLLCDEYKIFEETACDCVNVCAGQITGFGESKVAAAEKVAAFNKRALTSDGCCPGSGASQFVYAAGPSNCVPPVCLPPALVDNQYINVETNSVGCCPICPVWIGTNSNPLQVLISRIPGEECFWENFLLDMCPQGPIAPSTVFSTTDANGCSQLTQVFKFGIFLFTVRLCGFRLTNCGCAQYMATFRNVSQYQSSKLMSNALVVGAQKFSAELVGIGVGDAASMENVLNMDNLKQPQLLQNNRLLNPSA